MKQSTQYQLLVLFFVACIQVGSAQTNLLHNPGFEYPISQSVTETIYSNNYKSLVRTNLFFDVNSQTNYPTISPAVAIPDTIWYKRATAQWQVKAVVDNTISHSGILSLALWNIEGNTNPATASYYYHNLAQRVSLNNTKTYIFKFWVHRNFLERSKVNNVDTLRVGLLASNDTQSGNITYYHDISIPNNENWNEITVTFNLPEILSTHASLSFSSSVVFISMKTGWDGTATTQSKVNVDDISLSEYTPTSSFKIYDAINYVEKPIDLSNEGLSPINLFYQVKLTKPDASDPSKLVLDLDQIKANAKLVAASCPSEKIVSTDIEQWFDDSSVSETEMANRFATMFSIFRNEDPSVKIGNYGLAPSSLNIYRLYHTGINTTIINGWKAYNAKRLLSAQQADILHPVFYAGTPDINTWISDLQTTVFEIRQQEPTKKIVPYLWPQYYDKADNPYFKQFVSSEIWTQMLEAVFASCDGVVIWSSNTDENGNTVYWSDRRVQAMWIATQQFIGNHNIEKKTPLPYPDENRNILKNGSAENLINPSTISEVTYTVPHISLLRNTGFFDTNSQTINPNAEATPIPDYTWFEKGTSQWQVRTYVEESIAYSGCKSFALHNVGGSTSNATATSYWKHNLAQKVSLDDSKTYEFKFYVQRDTLYRGAPNTVSTLRVGIVSSTDAASATNSTYYKDVTILWNQEWNEIKVTFDLPAIITSNVGKSFNSCAVFIAMQTGWDGTKTTQAKVNVDDLSLIEVDNLATIHYPNLNNNERIRINDKTIYIYNITHSVSVYDFFGRLILNNENVNGNISFPINRSGVYFVKVDDQTSKIIIQ